MIDRIKDLLGRGDWRAITIHLPGGRTIRIPSRQHAWISPYGKLVIETSSTSLEIFRADEVTHVETEERAVHEVC